MLCSGARVETLQKAVDALNGKMMCHLLTTYYVWFSIMFATGPSEGYTRC